MREVGVALFFSGLLFPFFLWISGLLNILPGLRFKLSTTLLMTVWCGWHQFTFNLNCWCGLLCISAVSLIAFMFWSVLCWGYTLSLLLSLLKDDVLNLPQWEVQYAGEQGLLALTENRANVLVGVRFASILDNKMKLTKFGYVSARAIKKLSHFFGIIL